MNAIALMVDEHKIIKRMLGVMRSACLGLLHGKEMNYGDFELMIDFVRNFADKHHHGKEETILFNRMMDELGTLAEKLVKFGMLVEHDYGRMYIKELEEAIAKVREGDDAAKLDVIANAISYTHLLHRHIDKEDKVIYTFAERELKLETLNKVNLECDTFEAEKEKAGMQSKYIKLVESLEQKYNIQ